ncbi:hypothetical protein LB507_003952 [Fusarium sp. FIESC RH6]|nr:hypothetical protein LB507_003952 [Fusarium sp. FIESC RH6]
MIFPPFVPSLSEAYNFESGPSTPGTPSEISDEVLSVGFPQSMQLTWTTSSSAMALFISEPGSSVIYAALMPRGWQGPSYLYPGSTFAGDAMVSCNRSGERFTFQLPAVPSYSISANEVTMSFHRSRSNPRYSFSMRVEHEGSRRTESFEWRASSETQSGMYSMVWQLISLGRTSKSSSSRPKSAEVVAMIYEVSPTSVQRSGGFQFLGRSTSNYMGYHWMLMAVTSGIAVLQHASSE